MGLDIYAGTLTRYYTQNWKTAVQQFGEAHGIPVQIIRANPEEHPADEAEVLERVTEWRKHILNGLVGIIRRLVGIFVPERRLSNAKPI